MFSHTGSYATDPDLRPTVEVEIAAVTSQGAMIGKPVTTTVLVDSGADRTMLDGGLAATLGIDLTHCKLGIVGGVGQGGVPVAEASVKMQLCGRWLDVPVNFTIHPIGHVQLLGREGAFDALVWAFAHRQKTLLATAV